MGNTAATLGQFQDPFNYQTQGGPDQHEWMFTYPEDGPLPANPNSLGNKIADWLNLTDTQREYDQWVKSEERGYERASINSARAWEEYLDSTKYQRMKADLEKAGLNPWLALQSGASASAQGSSTSTGGSHSAKSSFNQSNAPKNLALGLIAVAKLLAVLLG